MLDCDAGDDSTKPDKKRRPNPLRRGGIRCQT